MSEPYHGHPKFASKKVNEPYPLAIAIADLHLSLLQPACRADKDWLETQAGYLKQVKDLAYELSKTAGHYLPILCAGDIFDKWNAPPELINFALRHLPDGMWCVPGQHDLPLHRTDLMHRSGYGVLKQTGKIRDLGKGWTVPKPARFVLYGYGWEEAIAPAAEDNRDLPHVALLHRYVWNDTRNKHPNAPDTARLTQFKKDLRGYDVAVFGDNHISFVSSVGRCAVLNCGTLLIRKSDEQALEPCVGILMSDGTCRRQKLDCSGDRFHKAGRVRPEVAFNMKEFIEGLEGLGEHGLDFRAAVENHLQTDELPPGVKEIILAALDNKA
jgi:hypothetical protein